MSLKDELEIFIVTYNRAAKLTATLKILLNSFVPTHDLKITILDNNSIDNTKEVALDFTSRYSNVSYVRNKFNIGMGGNIVKAFQLITHNYVWIVGDDDEFDFDNWAELERAIEQRRKVICVSRFAGPQYIDHSLVCQFAQLAFAPAMILKTSVLTDTIIKNIIDTVNTSMPHLSAVVHLLNNQEKIYVLSEGLIDNHFKPNEICSPSRGLTHSELMPKTQNMSLILGYSIILEGLNDKKLADTVFDFLAKGFYGSRKNCYETIISRYKNNPNYLMDIYSILSTTEKEVFMNMIKKAIKF